MKNELHPLIFVVGPTAVGKSKWALRVAPKVHGAIINCDSVQMYQGLDIGAAKPTLEERAICPHFLFDAIPTGGSLTAGDFRRLALDVLEEQTRSRPVFGVGGSGFYIQALEKGMFEVGKIDPEIESAVRRDLRDKGVEFLYEELQATDPETAEGINPNDHYRIHRAIAVIRGTQRRLSDLKREFKPQALPFPVLKIGFRMDRQVLRERVTARTRGMLESGLMDEVRGLWEQGHRFWPPLQSVGYRECVLCLRGLLAPQELEKTIIEKTMQLAKRQQTWFQRDRQIQWFDAESGFSAAEDWLFARLDMILK